MKTSCGLSLPVNRHGTRQNNVVPDNSAKLSSPKRKMVMPPFLRLNSTGDVISHSSPTDVMGHQTKNGHRSHEKPPRTMDGKTMGKTLIQLAPNSTPSSWRQSVIVNGGASAINELIRNTETLDKVTKSGMRSSTKNGHPPRANRYGQWSVIGSRYPCLPPGVFPCHVFSALQSSRGKQSMWSTRSQFPPTNGYTPLVGPPHVSILSTCEQFSKPAVQVAANTLHPRSNTTPVRNLEEGSKDSCSAIPQSDYLPSVPMTDSSQPGCSAMANVLLRVASEVKMPTVVLSPKTVTTSCDKKKTVSAAPSDETSQCAHCADNKGSDKESSVNTCAGCDKKRDSSVSHNKEEKILGVAFFGMQPHSPRKVEHHCSWQEEDEVDWDDVDSDTDGEKDQIDGDDSAWDCFLTSGLTMTSLFTVRKKEKKEEEEEEEVLEEKKATPKPNPEANRRWDRHYSSISGTEGPSPTKVQFSCGEDFDKVHLFERGEEEEMTMMEIQVERDRSRRNQGRAAELLRNKASSEDAVDSSPDLEADQSAGASAPQAGGEASPPRPCLKVVGAVGVAVVCFDCKNSSGEESTKQDEEDGENDELDDSFEISFEDCDGLVVGLELDESDSEEEEEEENDVSEEASKAEGKEEEEDEDDDIVFA